KVGLAADERVGGRVGWTHSADIMKPDPDLLIFGANLPLRADDADLELSFRYDDFSIDSDIPFDELREDDDASRLLGVAQGDRLYLRQDGHGGAEGPEEGNQSCQSHQNSSRRLHGRSPWRRPLQWTRATFEGSVRCDRDVCAGRVSKSHPHHARTSVPSFPIAHCPTRSVPRDEAVAVAEVVSCRDFDFSRGCRARANGRATRRNASSSSHG